MPVKAALSRVPSIRSDDLHRLRQVRQSVPRRLHLYREDQEPGRQGIPRQRLQDRLHEVHVLRTVRRSMPGRLHLHGLDVRSELLQPRRLHRRFREAAGGDGVGPGDAKSDRDCRVEAASRAGVGEAARSTAATETGARRNSARSCRTGGRFLRTHECRTQSATF